MDRPNRRRWQDSWGTHRWKRLFSRWSDYAATPAGQVFTADEPKTAGAAKYDATAVAMIALLKYGTGVPFKRLERLQVHLGMLLSATTQWDLMAAAAKLIQPVL